LSESRISRRLWYGSVMVLVSSTLSTSNATNVIGMERRRHYVPTRSISRNAGLKNPYSVTAT
jgi:hypothetical protein